MTTMSFAAVDDEYYAMDQARRRLKEIPLADIKARAEGLARATGDPDVRELASLLAALAEAIQRGAGASCE